MLDFAPATKLVQIFSRFDSSSVCNTAELLAAVAIASILACVVVQRSAGRVSAATFWLLFVAAIFLGSLQVLSVTLDMPQLLEFYRLMRAGTLVMLIGSAGLLLALVRRNTLLTHALERGSKLEWETHQRVLAEEELSKAESRFRTIFDNTRDVITCVDSYGRLLDVNKRVEDVFGYKPEEVIGKRFTKLGILWPRDILRVAQLFRQAIKQRNPSEILELDLHHKDGHTVSVEVGTRFVRRNGKILEIVNVFRDITERKRTINELALAKQAAEVANQAKSEFLANISHEIRTPITAILGYADAILESRSPNETIQAANVIKRNGDHLLEIISDILDLSKIEAGKIEICHVPCSPHEIAADAISLFKCRAQAKGLSLNLECRGAIPDRIRTDRVRLRQILVNLIGNAIKFTEAGGVRVVMQWTEPADKSGQLRFDIEDTGIGVSDEQIALLFRPFSQADGSVHRRFGGSGLGLAISKRLANILGGDIGVSSVPGAGSTFSATIATTIANEIEAHAVCGSASVPCRTDQSTITLDCRILLAEDSLDLQRIASRILRKAGARVETADNGQAAIDLAMASHHEGKPFDVVLMDIQMPVMDGYESVCRLRAMGYAGPVIALTAHAMKDDREKCLAAGCDEHLAKPVDRDRLIETVARQIRLKPHSHDCSAKAEAALAGE